MLTKTLINNNYNYLINSRLKFMNQIEIISKIKYRLLINYTKKLKMQINNKK